MRRAAAGRAVRIIGIPLLLAVGTACAVFYKQPQIAFRGVRFGEFGDEGAQLAISAEISNPNGFRLALKSLSYRIRVNGAEAAAGTTQSELVVPARGSATLTVPIAVDWTSVKAAGWEMLATGRLEYSVDGEAVFSTPVGTFRRKFFKTGER